VAFSTDALTFYSLAVLKQQWNLPQQKINYHLVYYIATAITSNRIYSAAHQAKWLGKK